jgi:glyoxylase-like metal-dependent hydrolase (beta-lactamase superfamily II)
MVPAEAHAPVFEALRLTVLERDWLSSNNVVFRDADGKGLAVVDTGYASHAPQTVALLDHIRGATPLTRILNTHLHSDHCGGNHALQAHFPTVQTWVPQAAFEKVQAWDQERLTYRLTGQQCEPFKAEHALVDGGHVELGGRPWQIHGMGGHDPDAVVLFEPEHRVLISGDALWRNKVAVIFPELDGEDGFAPALESLDRIEALNPAWVIPGHGQPFAEVSDALAISRSRLRKLQAQPTQHARHALRVLMVFHLMEHRRRSVDEVCRWLVEAPLARRPAVLRLMQEEPESMARVILDSLIADGVVHQHEGHVALA